MTYTRGPSYKLVTHVKSELNYKYKLYRFDQVSSRKHPSDSSLEVSGIPVLFIPGHLGDYKQVRSLGSLADELGDAGFTVHSIGDCTGVGYIEGAIEAAAEVAVTIC